MTTEIDILNTSWDTFQRVINHEQQIYLPRNNNVSAQENFITSQRVLPSFQEIFDNSKTSSPPSSLTSSEEDSDQFFESFFSIESLNTIKAETEMQDEYFPQQQHEENKIVQNHDIKQFIKREKPVFEKPKTIEIKLKANNLDHTEINSSKKNKKDLNSSSLLSKKNVSKASPNSKKVENVRSIWNNNLQQIINNNMIPLKRCLYKFENPSNCPWESKDGLYIFEIHLLQVLCPKEAWNFKRYVDNHSKKTGEGQTFTLCSSIHKDEWEFLQMKSNKFFKKARMININAFKEKNGFITKGKWKYIYSIFQKEFEDCIINTFNNVHPN